MKIYLDDDVHTSPKNVAQLWRHQGVLVNDHKSSSVESDHAWLKSMCLSHLKEMRELPEVLRMVDS